MQNGNGFRVAEPVSPLQTAATPHVDHHEQNAASQQVSPMMSRKTSIDSDRQSSISGLTTHFPSNPANVNPPPAYVAQFGAAQVVREHQSGQRLQSSDSEENEDEKKSKEDVQFSEPALALVNAFLDQLLYSFLSTARSTSLQALRPAVTEVLKHRLARDAIASAEEELAELLAGGEDDEDMDGGHNGTEHNNKWDLELVWKRTRLRVMVYVRLGEMEDEDEQRYVKEEELLHGSERRFSQTAGLVSWAAAIFLTSVLEYVAEQTLQVAGQAAYTRARRLSRTQRLASSTEVITSKGLLVEEYDVEKVALNSTLGRLWRTWRKAQRNNTSPITPTQRSHFSHGRWSRDNMAGAQSYQHSHQSSFSTAREGSDSRPISRDRQDEIPEMQYPEYVLAANIPLPIGNKTRDIDDIEVPGLARDPDADEGERESDDLPYPDHIVATNVPVPMFNETRDMDEIEVPGLALDPEEESDEDDSPYLPHPDHKVGALVPLPLADDKRDVDEIETPWLARDPDEVVADSEQSRSPKRRSSLHTFSPYQTTASLPIEASSDPTSPKEVEMPIIGRQRSMSHPSPIRAPTLEESAVEIPSEESKRGETLSGNDVVEDAPLPPDVRKGVIANHEPTSEPEKQMEDKQERAATPTPKTEYPWITTGAVAGASAAAGAWAYGSTRRTSNENRGFSGLIKNANKTDDRNEISYMRNVKKDFRQQSRSDEEVEELDKRKSLIDIKSLMVVNGPSDPNSGQESPQAEDAAKSTTPPALLRTVSSDYSQENESREDVLSNGIGVARTIDAPGASPHADGQQARDADDLVVLPNESHASENSTTPTTPRQYMDFTADSQQQMPGDPPTTIVAKYPERVSSKDVQRSPTAAVGEQPEPTRPSTSPRTNDQQVQEYPVLQPMAGARGIESTSAVDPDKPPLTSASIRGPEDFEAFVQGDDTIKYTLTPEPVRDEPMEEDTRYPTPRQAPTENSAALQALTAQAPDSQSDSRAGRSQDAKQATSATDDAEARAARRRSLLKPAPSNTRAHSKSGLMAREPRVQTESTRDFADFIRSTGPGKESEIYPILANASQTSLHSLRSAHINGASASRSSSPGGDRTRSLTKSVTENQNVPPVPPIPKKRVKKSMEPRAPTVKDKPNSELIDFIRSGPNQEGQHRIPRTVAPFRTTMDSDQFNDFDDRRSADRPNGSSLSTNVNGAASVRSTSSLKSTSHRTSVNSRSALLNGSGTAMPSSSGTSLLTSGPRNVAFKDEATGRKRYRNKDPYAIDVSDDEDDMVTALPQSKGRQESLIEFLNSQDPPNDGPPRPLIDPKSAQARNAINNARLSGAITNGKVSSMPGSSTPDPYYTNATQSNSGVTSPASSKPKMQPRIPGAKHREPDTTTRELATFFKATAPMDPSGAPAPVVGRGVRQTPAEEAKAKKKAEKKSSGFFGRSKKKTFLDMS